MTMFWDGGSTKMIAVSWFLSMKIYKRFVGVSPLFWAVPDYCHTISYHYSAIKVIISR